MATENYYAVLDEEQETQTGRTLTEDTSIQTFIESKYCPGYFKKQNEHVTKLRNSLIIQLMAQGITTIGLFVAYGRSDPEWSCLRNKDNNRIPAMYMLALKDLLIPALTIADGGNTDATLEGVKIRDITGQEGEIKHDNSSDTLSPDDSSLANPRPADFQVDTGERRKDATDSSGESKIDVSPS